MKPQWGLALILGILWIAVGIYFVVSVYRTSIGK